MGVTANETAQVQEGSALGFRRHKLALDVMSSLPLPPGTSLPSPAPLPYLYSWHRTCPPG